MQMTLLPHVAQLLPPIHFNKLIEVGQQVNYFENNMLCFRKQQKQISTYENKAIMICASIILRQKLILERASCSTNMYSFTQSGRHGSHNCVHRTILMCIRMIVIFGLSNFYMLRRYFQ